MERTDQEEALPSCVELGFRLRVTVTLKLMGSEGNFFIRESLMCSYQAGAHPAVSTLNSKFRLG